MDEQPAADVVADLRAAQNTSSVANPHRTRLAHLLPGQWPEAV